MLPVHSHSLFPLRKHWIQARGHNYIIFDKFWLFFYGDKYVLTQSEPWVWNNSLRLTKKGHHENTPAE